MGGALLWAGAFMACAAVGALAARRFAAAVRSSGGALLTDQERRDLFWEKPIRSFPAILADDLRGFNHLLRRQADPIAERWRRLSIAGWAAALAVMVAPLVTRVFSPANGGSIGPAIPNFITPIALLIAAFWAVQLMVGIVRGRNQRALLLCAVGIVGGVAFAVGAELWWSAA